MTATDELREMLDECGIEYKADDRNGLRETIWCGMAAFQLSPTAKMTMIVTPEQAIAATLGSGTCELVETDRYTNSRETIHVLECSECGETCEHVNGIYPRCPHCGKAVKR